MRLLYLHIFLLLLLTACSSGGNSEQISEDLADRMSDSLEFDGGELEETPMPEGQESPEAPQLTKVESEEPLRIGDPFVIELETDFNNPQTINRVLMQVVGSSKHFVINTGVVVTEDKKMITLSGILKADEELKGLKVTMLFALKTEDGSLGLSRELKIAVTEEDVRGTSTELETDDPLWSNIPRPDTLSSDEAPQILRIEAPEIVIVDEPFDVAIFSRSSEATSILLTTIGNDECLTTTFDEKTVQDNYTVYKFEMKIPNKNILEQKLVILFALQKDDDTTGLFVPKTFILKSSSSTDGDEDTVDRESIIQKCEEHNICCIGGFPTNEFKSCEPLTTATSDETYRSLCVDGECIALSVRKIVDDSSTPNLSPVNSFDLSPTGKWLVSVHDDGVARVYSLKDDTEIKSFGTDLEDTGGFISPLNTVSYHPLYNVFAVGSANGYLVSYDVENERLLSRTAFGSYKINSVEYSPDGTFLALSKTELETLKARQINYFDLFIQDSQLTLWVYENPNAEFHTVGFFNETDLAYAASTSEFAVMNLNKSENTFTAKPTDVVNDTTDNNAQWNAVSISPDGKLFAGAGCVEEDSTSSDNPAACLSSRLEIKTTDLAESTQFQDIRIDKSLMTAVAFSPGGNQIAYAYCKNLLRASSLENCDSAKITLVNINSGEEIYTFEKHNAPVTHLAFDPYANQLISSDREGLIFIWDIYPFADENTEFCKSDEDCDNKYFCNMKKHLCSPNQCNDSIDNNGDSARDTEDDYCSAVIGAKVELPVQ